MAVCGLYLHPDSKYPDGIGLLQTHHGNSASEAARFAGLAGRGAVWRNTDTLLFCRLEGGMESLCEYSSRSRMARSLGVRRNALELQALSPEGDAVACVTTGADDRQPLSKLEVVDVATGHSTIVRRSGSPIEAVVWASQAHLFVAESRLLACDERGMFKRKAAGTTRLLLLDTRTGRVRVIAKNVAALATNVTRASAH